MSTELITLILIGIMLFFLVIGAEVFVALAFAAGIGLIFFVGQPLAQFAYTAYNTADNFVLIAVPLFVFMGAVFSNSGTVSSLLLAADKWVGWLPGGLVASVIGANTVFGAMCGSPIAATATFGEIAYPQMEKMGYSHKLTLGALAVGGLLSAAIPPSVTLIVYGSFAEVSVARLFAAVLLPGLTLSILLTLTVIILVKLNPSLTPEPSHATWGERLIALRNMLPWLAIIISMLGAIFTGIMTPTEAAGLGAALSLILALGYRRMNLTVLKQSSLTAAKITVMATFLLFSAKALGIVFTHINLPQLFSDLLLGLPLGKYVILAFLSVVYFIGGCFIHDWAMLLITLPFVLPVLTGLGFSPVWFGVYFIMVGEVGAITPPFGMCLFSLHSVVPKHDTMTIARSAAPFIIPMLVTGVILAVFPDLALWLPNQLY